MHSYRMHWEPPHLRARSVRLNDWRDEGDLLWIPDGEITIDELLKLKEVREEDWSGKFERERWMEASKAGRIRIRDPNGSFHEYLERGSRKASRKRSKID
jgi:hypothetical protein